MAREIEPTSRQRLLNLLRDPNRRNLARRIAEALVAVEAGPKDPGFRYRDFIGEDGLRRRLVTRYGNDEQWAIIWRDSDPVVFDYIGPAASL